MKPAFTRAIVVALIAALLPAATARADLIALSGSVNLASSPQEINLEGGLVVEKDPGENLWDFTAVVAGGPYTGVDLAAFNITHSLNSVVLVLKLDMGGADLLSSGGYIQAGGSSTNADGGDIEIVNVGNVSLGSGYISSFTAGSGETGYILIGESGNRAGTVQVASITSNRADIAGDHISIHGSGDVTIGHDDGGGFAPGNLAIAGGNSEHHVLVSHEGSFVADTVSVISGRSGSTPGSIVFNGAAVSGTPSGNFQVATLKAEGYNSHATSNQSAPSAITTISNYLSVEIDVVDTFTASAGGGNSSNAGNVTISDITGDITIGSIDAHAFGTNLLSRRGIISLTAGGTITLGGLDMDLVQSVSFDAGSGSAYITGALLNFDVDNPLTSGLDAPSGQIIYYDPGVAENAYLDSIHGSVYALPSGGLLGPGVEVPEPATLILLGLGGLTLAGSAIRRRRSQ